MTESTEPAAGYPFPTDFRNGQGLCQINDRFLNNISKFILGLDIQVKKDITDPYIDRSDGNPENWTIYIPSGSGGLDLTKAALGYKINPLGTNPALVRIYSGEIDRIPVAQADLTVTDGDYIYIRRTIADNAMTILAGSSVPADDATYYYYKLYEFTVDTGVTPSVTTIKKIWRPFAIEDINWLNILVTTGVTIPIAGADRTFKARELDVCVNGVAQKMLIFASEPYSAT